MRLRRLGRGSQIRLRADDFVELPRNYTDAVIYDAAAAGRGGDGDGKEEEEELRQECACGSDAEASTDFEFDISMPGTDDDDDDEEEQEGGDEEEGHSGSAIPELDLNELIILANQLVRNSPPTVASVATGVAATASGEAGGSGSTVANVHIRFPLIRTINEARDVIMHYERLHGRSTGINGRVDDGRDAGGDGDGDRDGGSIEEGAGDHGIVWDSIVQDYSGISISGTRAYDASTGGGGGGGAGGAAGVNNVNVNLNSNVNVENMHRQPVWLELAGLATVTMFMFAVYRLVTNLVSISAFSENVVGDVVTFVEYVNDKTYYKHVSHPVENTSLIYKFGLIIKQEMPYLPDTIWLVLTVLAFSAYTVLTSGVVLTSMLFATMCLTMCVVLRWRHLGDFILRVVDNGERCL